MYRRLLLRPHFLRRSSSIASTTTTTTFCAALSTTTTTTTFRPMESYEAEQHKEMRRRYHRRLGGLKPNKTLKAIFLNGRIDSLLKGGDSDSDLDLASALIHDAADEDVLSQDTICSCTLILDSMFLAGRYKDVFSLFDLFLTKKQRWSLDTNAYNILINAHCHTAQIDQAFILFDHLIRKNKVDSHTYRILIKGLVSANRILDARNLLSDMTAMFGCGRGGAFAYNNVIFGYLELNDDVQTANQLFDELVLDSSCSSNADLGVIYATYMDYYFKRSMEKEAMESYQSLLDRQLMELASVETNNKLLEVLLKHGKTIEANTLFDNMLNSHSSPNRDAFNSQTFNLMVNHCFKLGKVSDALLVFKTRGAHENVIPFVMDALGYNNIIGKLCDIGMIDEADKLFKEMPKKSRDVTTYRILLDAYFKQDRIDDVLEWFKYLLFTTGLKPSSAFVNSVLGRLIDVGKIEEAGKILVGIMLVDHVAYPTKYELSLKNDRLRHLLGLVGMHKFGLTAETHDVLRETFGNEQSIQKMQSLSRRPTKAIYGGIPQKPDIYAPSFRHSPAPTLC